ncbi:MAG: N-acetylneuraminate synthase family protein [Alphaproteobacteria bacterium]
MTKHSKDIEIGRHRIGVDQPVYFIADIAANHDGDLGRAIDLIHLCADAGAQAAKFQNFRASTIVSDFGFRSLGTQQGHQSKWKKSVIDVYEEASLPLGWTPQLREACDKSGIDYFTTPYDLDLLAQLSEFVCAWKLGSGDITWHENILALASEGKPLLIATGASDMNEVRAAVEVAKTQTDDIVLMQCNTNYTGSLENFRHIALNVLKTYATEFPDVVLGLSDHTPGHATVLGSVALGARAIEKHFTDSTGRDGPDHAFAMDPKAWREMVDRTRELELALGPSEKRVMENERETVVVQRRSLRVKKDIAEGSVLTGDDLAPLRPCPPDAISPYKMNEVVGRRLRRSIPAGDYVRWNDLA